MSWEIWIVNQKVKQVNDILDTHVKLFCFWTNSLLNYVEVLGLILGKTGQMERKLSNWKIRMSWAYLLNLFVQYICSAYLLNMFAHHICSAYLLSMFAQHICSVYWLSIFAQHVCSAYLLSIFSQHICSACLLII